MNGGSACLDTEGSISITRVFTTILTVRPLVLFPHKLTSLESILLAICNVFVTETGCCLRYSCSLGVNTSTDISGAKYLLLREKEVFFF